MSTMRDADTLLEELGSHRREREENVEAIQEGPLAPLEAEEQQALEDDVLARLGIGTAHDARSSESVTAPERASAPFADPHAHSGEAGGQVVAMRPRSMITRTWPAVTATLAAAAAVLLFALPRRGHDALPKYSLITPSSDARFRGDAPEPSGSADALPSYALGRQLELVLRPATRAEGEFDAAVFLVDGDVPTRLQAPAHHISGGGMRLVIPTGVDTPLHEVGTHQLDILVGAAGSLGEASTAHRPDPESPLQRFSFSFELVP